VWRWVRWLTALYGRCAGGLALQLTAACALVLLFPESFVVVPSGAAGAGVSEIWGARPGTLYHGVHLVTPLVDSIAIYDTREPVYSTLAAENSKQKGDVLTVQATQAAATAAMQRKEMRTARNGCANGLR
jgi:hypothetical protein